MKTVKQELVLVGDARSLHTEPRAMLNMSWLEDDEDYVVMSDAVEIEFPMRAADDVIKQQLAGLKRREETETERHAEVLAAIEDARSKLQALTHDS